MTLERIDCLIFGYRRIEISEADLAGATTRLLLKGIPIIINGKGSFTVRERDAEAMRSALSGVEYTESERLGLLGKIKSFRHKIALALGLIASLMIIILSSSIVWDVRIEGNERLTDAAIKRELEECGFSVGTSWIRADKSEIEARVLSDSADIGWININRRGTVAYVKVIEKEIIDAPKEDAELGYSNIVATADCIIEEITVTKGQAAVKVGDVVRAGDVLILGALPESSGGGLCAAEGTVRGRVSDTVSVEVSREYEKKINAKTHINEIELNFFGFDLNIFKNYGNLPEDCDIIEEIRTFSLFGRCALPLSLSVTKGENYEIEITEYTDSQLVSVALSRLREKTHGLLSGCDLLRIRTDGEFTDSGYISRNYLTYIRDVGVKVPLSSE